MFTNTHCNRLASLLHFTASSLASRYAMFPVLTRCSWEASPMNVWRAFAITPSNCNPSAGASCEGDRFGKEWGLVPWMKIYKWRTVYGICRGLPWFVEYLSFFGIIFLVNGVWDAVVMYEENGRDEKKRDEFQHVFESEIKNRAL